MNWLEAFEAFILGMIQGLTEFLPVSSTGHLYLGRLFFNLQEAGLFLDTMLHIGTLVAVVIVYWKDILAIVRKPFSRLSLLLILGTIPTLIIALVLKDIVEDLSKTGLTIGWEFLLTGAILWVSDDLKKTGYKNIEKITYFDAILIGIFQGLAVLPAISRSGMTIAAALFRRVEKETAASYSFLLSIPAITVAIAYQSLELFKGGAGTQSVSIPALVIGIIASGIFGYLAVRWMIAILKKYSLKWFAIYVWILGVGIIIAQNIHFLNF